MPKSSVIRFARSVCAASDKLFNTPHSLSRFPNIKKPTNATDAGAINPTIIVVTMGKAIRMALDTLPGWYSIWIARSFFVVTSFMAKGCTMGTNAI